MEFQNTKAEMESFFGRNTSTWTEYTKILEARIRDVYIGTYVGASKPVRLYQLYALHFKTIDFVLNRLDLNFTAVVLNPKHAYTMVPSQEMFRGLKDTFGR
jgi:hypothetical protein